MTHKTWTSETGTRLSNLVWLTPLFPQVACMAPSFAADQSWPFPPLSRLFPIAISVQFISIHDPYSRPRNTRQFSPRRAFLYWDPLLQRVSDASTNVRWVGNSPWWLLNRVWERTQEQTVPRGIAGLSGGMCWSPSNGIMVNNRWRRWQEHFRLHAWSKTKLKI